MDYNVRVQYHFPAASLQTWATPEKQFTSIRSSNKATGHTLWQPHFRTFCELVEGEENKLTTFFTWTIVLGFNESNIIFQQHLCKLGQLRRSNGRNSQVFGQAMKKRPTGHTIWPLVQYESVAAINSFSGHIVWPVGLFFIA